MCELNFWAHVWCVSDFVFKTRCYMTYALLVLPIKQICALFAYAEISLCWCLCWNSWYGCVRLHFFFLFDFGPCYFFICSTKFAPLMFFNSFMIPIMFRFLFFFIVPPWCVSACVVWKQYELLMQDGFTCVFSLSLTCQT